MARETLRPSDWSILDTWDAEESQVVNEKAYNLATNFRLRYQLLSKKKRQSRTPNSFLKKLLLSVVK